MAIAGATTISITAQRPDYRAQTLPHLVTAKSNVPRAISAPHQLAKPWCVMSNLRVFRPAIMLYNLFRPSQYCTVCNRYEAANALAEELLYRSSYSRTADTAV